MGGFDNHLTVAARAVRQPKTASVGVCLPYLSLGSCFERYLLQRSE